MVKRALRAVDVLRGLLVGLQRPATKSDEPAGDVPDGENDPSTVEVIQGSIVPALGQSARLQPLLLVTRLLGGFDQGTRLAPRRLRTIADREVFNGRVPEPALPQVAEAHALALPGLHQLLGEPLLGPRRQVGQTLPFGLLLLLLLGQLPLLDLDAILVGQPPQRFGVGQLLVLHQEGHGAAPLVGAEALEDALAGHHVEGGGLLVGEGAQSTQARPALFELDEIRDHIFNDGGLQDGVDGVLRDHAVGKRIGKVAPPFRSSPRRWRQSAMSLNPLPCTLRISTRSSSLRCLRSLAMYTSMLRPLK